MKLYNWFGHRVRFFIEVAQIMIILLIKWKRVYLVQSISFQKNLFLRNCEYSWDKWEFTYVSHKIWTNLREQKNNKRKNLDDKEEKH